MHILVSNISKVYGMSKQNLYYYESRGILKPIRDATNGYRYYDTPDLQKLGTIKKMRNAGFPLSMGFDIQKGISSADLQNAYFERRKELYEDIHAMLRIVHQLDEDSVVLAQYSQRNSNWYIESYPERVRFEFYDEDPVMVDPALREKAEPWFKNVFFTSASYMYYTDENGQFSSMSRGLITTSQLAYELNIPITEDIQVLPAGKYATATFHITGSDADSLQNLLSDIYSSYKNDLTFKSDGPLFSRVVQLFKNQNMKYECYVQAYTRLKE